MRRWLGPAILFATAFLRAGEVPFAPIMTESAVILPYRHAVDIRLDLVMDSFKIPVGTETLKAMFTRAQPRLEYRYAPARNAEIFFRGLYTAQNVELTAEGGQRIQGRYSAGMSAPTVGFKLQMGKIGAVQLHTTPATAANRDPRLGDGRHDGAKLLYGRGRWHASLGHTVRQSYDVRTSSGLVRRDAGDVTEFSLATTKHGIPFEAGKDFVAPVAELQMFFMDRERLGGYGVRASSGLTGKVAFGFVLGKMNRHVTHLTSVSAAIGMGDVLHKTEDPLFGVGDLQLLISYGMRWGRFL